MIEKNPFTPYKLEKEREKESGKVFAIRLNESELKNLKIAQRLLQQEKESTCIKQLVTFGLFVLQERSTVHILAVLDNNIRKNKRLGIENVQINP